MAETTFGVKDLIFSRFEKFIFLGRKKIFSGQKNKFCIFERLEPMRNHQIFDCWKILTKQIGWYIFNTNSALLSVLYRFFLGLISHFSRSFLGRPSVRWLLERGSSEGRPRVERESSESRGRLEREKSERIPRLEREITFLVKGQIFSWPFQWLIR